jgi:phosphatidylserine decarboxylase
MYIHREGNATLIVVLITLGILTYVVHLFAAIVFWPFLVLAIAFYLFIISFFRNPKRIVPQLSEDIMYAPADGKVVVIEKAFESEVLKQEMMQVSIFMSPLNVHVNRNPITGTIDFYKYHPGKYLAAWNPKASTENERTTIVYETKHGKFLMRQIAGALARRIVCYAKKGDTGHQGKEIGFIKFGSRVDLFLPLNAKIEVEMDQVVKGNLTRIASFEK